MTTTSTESRPLVPMQEAMSNITFAPPSLGPQNDKKNFVFVDEHNRHRRLKVVRACDGCRRRKIKCDSATTNQWPCAACQRLKLTCIPPAVSYERNSLDHNAKFGLQGVLDFDQSSGSGDEDYMLPPQSDGLGWDIHPPAHVQLPTSTYDPGLGAFGTPPYSAPISQQEFAVNDMSHIPLDDPHATFNDLGSFNLPPRSSVPRSDSETLSQGAAGTSDLSELLGDLKINLNGVAPYISQQKKILAEAPAYEEVEAKLPRTTSLTGSSVRIPPELMPSDEQCLKYFDIFFQHIHPYVPVISKPYFYQQWKTNRRSISPLILEAIFACAGRMSDDAAQGAQWLALSSSHEDCFMDVPRLSTVQAMMILLKARESAPKRGYYYRSWITIKKIITMANDLDLHEHLDQHKDGQSCGSDPTECLIKTRIWQTLFVLEVMVGAPQGRVDMGIEPETVDLSVQRPVPGIDGSDYQISRQFTHLVRKIFFVRKAHDLKGKIKGAPISELIHNPQFAAMGSTLDKWLEDLPRDLQVSFPADDAVPWLPSHFVGNMHAYFHLTRVMLHRPLLTDPSSLADGSCARHLAICYDSSKKMCKLHESILQNFGITGLLCMQRGVNFVIYCVLTCTMVHLVAITSPDPEINRDAKDYFTRHMRILETCNSAWPQQDMQKQIHALREAFSADTSKPFELKPELLYGSPSASTMQPSPPLDHQYQMPNLQRRTSPHSAGQPMSFHQGPLTPPMTAALEAPQNGSLSSLSNGVLSDGQHGAANNHQISWNPAPIFEGWNAAFGENSASMAEVTATVSQQSPPLYSPAALGLTHHQNPLTDSLNPHHQQQDPQLQHQHPQLQQPYSIPPHIPPLPRQNSAQATAGAAAEPSFVSANMWRQNLANTWDRGALKRAWDEQAGASSATSYFGDSNIAAKRSR